MRQKKAFTLIELLVVISIIALLLSILMPSLTKVKKQAQFVICKTNLHNYSLAINMYLQDFNDDFPEAFIWLRADGLSNLYNYICKWHDKTVKPDGTLWPYLEDKGVHMCPTFLSDAIATGPLNPGDDGTIPFDPQYSYSMNSFFGYNAEKLSKVPYGSALTWLTDQRITKITQVRRPSELLIFSEENYKAIPTMASIGLNNNDLYMRTNSTSNFDFLTNNLATYHKAKANDRGSGIANVLFVDGHIDSADDNDGYGIATPRAFRSSNYSKWTEEE